MNKKHIVIIGLGGVGGYFGFKISLFSSLFTNICRLGFPGFASIFNEFLSV